MLFPLVGMFLSIAPLVGCGGYSSPEEALRGVQDAASDKDWRRVLAAFTSESQDKLVGSTVMAARWLAIGNRDVRQILDSHGFDPNKLEGSGEEENESSGLFADLTATPEQYARAIDSKAAFFADILEWSDRKGYPIAEGLFSLAGAELTDIQIDGGSARGSLSVSALGGPTIRFKRSFGRWYIDTP
jgi:hypothetical protein